MAAMTAMAAAVALKRENRSSRNEASGGVDMIVIPSVWRDFWSGTLVFGTPIPRLSIGPGFSYVTSILQNLQLILQ